MSQDGGETTTRATTTPEPPEATPAQDGASRGVSWEVAELIVEDGTAPGPGLEGRSSFLDQLKSQLEDMVDAEMTATPWQGRNCPWISEYVEGFRTRPLVEVRRSAARYGHRTAPGSALPGLRAAIVDRARDGLRRWRATGEMPRLPPGVPQPTTDLAGAARLLRRADGSGRAPEAVAPAAVRSRLGPGRSLDPGDQTWLERSLGHDLSEVRLHDDGAAHDAAAGQAARAFAVGSDIVLGAGAATASPLARRALLAHEAAHVVQQRGPGTASDAALEDDADMAAAHAVLDRPGAAPARRGGLQLQACGAPAAMSEEELTAYLAENHLRVVVTQETREFLTGMKKSVAVAANTDPAVQQPVKQPSDQIIVKGIDFPRLTYVAVDMPWPDGTRSSRPVVMHPHTGTFTISFEFPGRYDITAYVLLAPGHVQELHRSVEVRKADFVGESEKAAPEQLAAQQPSTPAMERLGLTLQRADLRQRAVDAGHLSKAVADAWTGVSLAVVARAGALQAGEAGPGTGTAVADALGHLETSFGTVPAGLQAPIGALRSRAFAADLGRLRSATDLLARAFDTWVLDQVKGKPGGEDIAKGLEYTAKIEAEVAGIERRAKGGGAVRVPAVFHPAAAYVRHEVFVAAPTNLGEIMALPLNLWLFSEGGTDWTLRDITNPEETFEYDTSNKDRDLAIDNLIKQLADDEEHWPTGRLHVQHPGRGRQSFSTESDMDFLDWLGVIALVLTAAGLIMITAGAATPGVVAAGGYLLTASAVVGATAAIVDTVDAYERGRLTGKRLALNALQVVASAATAGTSTIFANSARQGVGGLAKLGTNARYIFLNRAAATSDVVTLLVMTGDTALQLAKMSLKGGQGQDNAMRAALALGQLLVQGTVTMVSARDAFRGGDLSSHPAVALHEAADGSVVVRNAGAVSADPKVPATPRTAEDLLDASGTHFAADHKSLREAYDQYRARCKARGETALDPLDWVKFQSQGKPAQYLDATLPAGWREARRGQYPGSRPHLVDRPSNAPPEGSIDATTGKRWRYNRVTVDDLRPAVDEVGDPYWTFPDLQDGEVLILPSGTRVWKQPVTGAVVEEHPLSASVSGQRSRTAGEATLMSRQDLGPAHAAAKTERSHGAASPGLGFDSPYGVAHAPRKVNQTLERSGIEMYLRRLRDNAPPGVTYLSTTSTQVRAPNRTLTERIYRIDAIKDGQIHPLFEFKVVVEGGVGDANARFVVDEMSVLPGAEAFASPKLLTQPKGAPPEGVGVKLPTVLEAAMTRPPSGRAPVTPPPPTPGFESSQSLRGRLDDLLETRISGAGLDAAWMDAQAEAVDVLLRAEAHVLGGTDAGKQQQLRVLVAELNRRAGRHPATVTAARLREFAAAVEALL